MRVQQKQAFESPEQALIVEMYEQWIAKSTEICLYILDLFLKGAIAGFYKI